MSWYSVSFTGQPSSSVQKFALVDFERRAGFPVAIVDRHLDGGAVLLDQKIARVEDHEVELFHDEPQALERLFLAAAGGGCRSTGMWIT